MPTDAVETCPCGTRDLADLLKTPFRPLTQDEKEHLDEYMSFKNHDISARDVNLKASTDDIIDNLDYYMGFSKEKNNEQRA